MEEVLEASLVWGELVLETVTVPLWDKVTVGALFAVPEELGVRVIDFGPSPFVGERKMVTWGSLHVVVEVALSELPPARAKADGALLVGLALAAAAHAFLLLAGQTLPAEDTEITADRVVTMRAYLSDDDADVAKPSQRLEQQRGATEGRFDFGAGSGPGMAGARTTTRGPFAGAPLGAAAVSSVDAASANFGIVSLVDTIALGTSTMPGSSIRATGIDWTGGEGGGLALSGIGDGGGGPGRGVSVDPNLGLSSGAGAAGVTCDDQCARDRDRVGYSFGHGVARGNAHTVKSPTICGGDAGCAPSVTGRLPPEAIQRVVRANQGRYRACYEDALLHNPTLEGRVAVDFVIGRDGSVAVAREGEGSSLADAAVRACVVRAFAGLSFPEPAGGVVHVTYPLVFAAD